MKSLNLIKSTIIVLVVLFTAVSCKEDETYKPIPDIVYITSNAVTGPGSNASTAITNSASGKVSVSPAVARVYVNTLKNVDVTVTYTLAGTAVAGTNYSVPARQSVTIPAGQWYADINIEVINTPLPANRTIIINLATASNDVQIGLGTDRNYRTFTYTLTN